MAVLRTSFKIVFSLQSGVLLGISIEQTTKNHRIRATPVQAKPRISSTEMFRSTEVVASVS